ncbi:YtxH domain-containing protein [Nocardioides sp. Bht2]|uniref:YtxH domain-containing protein n=1 Tax=Nocardioides sp. Bht2 TaxID=3392297 RepID=UPI0039B624A5
MGKLGFLAGAGVGYVLGARAGRERYEQIKHLTQRAWHNPRVQRQAAHAQAVVAEKASQAQNVVSEKATHAASYVQEAVKEQVHGMAGHGETAPGSSGTTPPRP